MSSDCGRRPTLLYNDLLRQTSRIEQARLEASIDTGAGTLKIPILVTTTDGREFAIALSSPLADGRPADRTLAEFCAEERGARVIVENELLVRSDLPAATRRVLELMNET